MPRRRRLHSAAGDRRNSSRTRCGPRRRPSISGSHPLQPATGATRVAPVAGPVAGRPSPAPTLCSRRPAQLESHPLRAPSPAVHLRLPPSTAGDRRNSSRTRCGPRRRPSISGSHPLQPATGATRVAPVAGPVAGRPSPAPTLYSRRQAQLESHPLRAPSPAVHLRLPPSAAGDRRNSSRTRCGPRSSCCAVDGRASWSMAAVGGERVVAAKAQLVWGRRQAAVRRGCWRWVKTRLRERGGGAGAA